MTYSLNLRFLIKLLIVAGVVIGATHALHRRQAGRQVRLYHHLAEAARAEGKPDREIRYLDRYLALRPDDVDARERLGRVRYEQAKTNRDVLEAYLVLEDALRRDDTRPGLRRHVVDVALDPRLGLVAEAGQHVGVLLAASPADGDLEGLMGRCLEAEGNLVRANEFYKASIDHKPDRVDSYARRAALLRRVHEPFPRDPAARDLPAEADGVITALVERNPGSFRARLVAAHYWRAVGRADAAQAQVAAARDLAPDEVEVILVDAAVRRDLVRRLARQPKANGNALRAARDEARALLDRGLVLHARLPAVHQARADVELDAGRPDEAEAILRKAAEALPESLDLWLSLVDVKVRRSDPAGAAHALARCRELDLPGPLADYQAARIEAVGERWLEAARTLARIRDDLAGTPHARPANLLLGRCYEQIGEMDRRVEALTRAAAGGDPSDPVWVQATLRLAEARAALGQTEVALGLYQTLTPHVPVGWVGVARLRLGLVLRQPEGARDLRAAQEAVRQAAQAVPDSTDVALLQADLLHLQKDPAAARRLLADLRARHEADVDVWVAVAVQELRDGDRARAAATLDQARQRLGDSVTLRLARARLLIDPAAPDAAGQFAALGPADADAFSAGDRRRLTRGLAEIASAAGATAAAGDLWEKAAAAAPDNLEVHLNRFDRALLASDLSAAERVLAQIRDVDGADGTTHRAARAIYLLQRAQADPAETAARDEAGRLFDALEVERPGWSRVALGQAVVADLRRDPGRALGRYQRAIDQGERDPGVVRRVVELLAARGRWAEAQAALEKVPPAALGAADLSRLATEVSLLSRRPDLALRHAARAIPRDSADYRDQLWLARVYWAAGAKDQWEAPLRKAVAGANGDPAPLIALVEFLIASGRRAEADQAAAAGIDAVAPDQRLLARAQWHQLAGRAREAEQSYRDAQAERPADLRVLRAYADFLMRVGKFGPAEGVWVQINNLRETTEEDRQWARQMIAVCASLDPTKDYQSARAALAAIGLLDGDRPRTPAEDLKPDGLRAAATTLALQVDRASKVQAIRYLERLEDVLLTTGQNPTPADRFLRAQLHAALNQPDAVRSQMRLVLADARDHPVYLAFHVAFLVRQERPEWLPEAERWLARLEAVQKDAPRTAELRARLAAARQNDPDVGRALAALEAHPDARPAAVASLYEELGRFPDAGRLYQRLADQAKRPEALLPYAMFLGRRQETGKALDRCEEARKQKCPPAALATAGVAILYAARDPRPADAARVLGWITDGLPAVADRPALTAELLNRQAAVLNLQGRYEEAIAVYERLLRLDPRDAVAMNNLAYLLAAHRKQFGPAHRWVEAAKGVVGPLPELLDTEALVHLAQAKADPAAAGRSLEAALTLLADVEVQAPSAAAYFHLAQARMAGGKPLEARLAWQEARRRKLSPADLHPLERAEHTALDKALGG